MRDVVSPIAKPATEPHGGEIRTRATLAQIDVPLLTVTNSGVFARSGPVSASLARQSEEATRRANANVAGALTRCGSSGGELLGLQSLGTPA